MRRFLPDSLFGQTVLVLVVGLTVSHLLSMAIYSSDRVEVLTMTGGRQIAQRIASITRLLGETPVEWRDRIIAATDSPSLRVTLTPESVLVTLDEEDREAAAIRAHLEDLLGVEGRLIVRLIDRADSGPKGLLDGPAERMNMHMARMIRGWPVDQSLLVSVHLDDGHWLNFATDIPESDSLWSSRAFFSMALMALGVIVLSFWVVRRMTKPLSTLARAADYLGRDVNSPPLSEVGPSESRRVARAFNEMQQRLRRLIEGRTQMLAAISHDLRTPITLLRLRAEFIDDAEEQKKTMATLDEMESMISSTLAFARDDAEKEKPRVVDIAALIGSIRDDMEDAGQPVAFDAAPRLAYECRAIALKRALANLIENAVKYGHRARIRLEDTADCIRIVVDDDGPGILGEELEKVYTPFYRIEGSRSRETGGVGLGLSVARSVVRAHGGDIQLTNREEGGLRATVELPR